MLPEDAPGGLVYCNPQPASCPGRLPAGVQAASAHLQDLGEDSGGEQGGVLDDDVVALVLVGHVQLVQEAVRGLAHHHGTEQLPAQPGAAAGGHALLDERHLRTQARRIATRSLQQNEQECLQLTAARHRL